MSALLELVADMVSALFYGWLPERRLWRWLVYALYAAIFVLGVIIVVPTLT